jgi:hypothetical protein
MRDAELANGVRRRTTYEERDVRPLKVVLLNKLVM